MAMSTGAKWIIGLGVVGVAGLALWGMGQAAEGSAEAKKQLFADTDALYRRMRNEGRSRPSARRVIQGYLGPRDYREWARSRPILLQK